MAKTTSRRDRDIARIREEILVAATRAFARTGYHSATMRDIAREAGYTPASLYAYYESKQEILQTLRTRVLESIRRRFSEPVPDGLTFVQRLDLLARRMLGEIEERRELLAMFMGLPGDELSEEGREHGPLWVLEMQIDHVTRWFRRHARPDELGHRRAADVARVLVALGHSFIYQWAMEGAKPGVLISKVDLLLSLALHGIAGPPEEVARPATATKGKPRAPRAKGGR